MARGSGIGNAWGYWGDSIRRGLSQNKAIEAFRNAGGSGSNEVLREGFKAARESAARYANITQLPGDQVAGDEHWQPWKAGRPGRYAAGVDAYIYDRNSKMTYIANWTPISDDPMTPDEYAQYAMDEIEEYQTESEKWKGQVVLFTRVRGLYRTV